MSGFFAIDRAIFDHPMFASETYTEVQAWIWMIGQAAWKDTRARVGRAPIDLKRGQMAFATRFLATKWRWSEARVRRFLKRLQSDAMIVVQTTRDATQITICNYDEYQLGRRTDVASSDAQTDELPTHRRRKEEENKQGKKEEDTSSLRSAVAPAKNVSRGTRLPEDWKPDDDGIAFAVEALGTRDAARAEFAKFQDHWRQASGANASKRDWPAAWRNWVRNSVDRRRPSYGGRGPPSARLSLADVAAAARNHLNGHHPTDPEPRFDIDLTAEPNPRFRSGTG